MTELKTGQKVNVPRGIQGEIQKIIAQREEYQYKAFRGLAEVFGLGAKDIGDKQDWVVRVDWKNWQAYLADKQAEPDESGYPPPRKGTEKKSVDEVCEYLCLLDVTNHMNPVVVQLLSTYMKDINGYQWKLLPAEMKVEIMGRRPENLEDELGIFEGLQPVGGQVQ